LRILPWNGYRVRCNDVHPWEGNSRPMAGYKLSRQRFEHLHPDFCAFAYGMQVYSVNIFCSVCDTLLGMLGSETLIY